MTVSKRCVADFRPLKVCLRAVNITASPGLKRGSDYHCLQLPLPDSLSSRLSSGQKYIPSNFAMLKSVEFMSLEAMKSLQPSKAVAVISIHDSSTIRDLPNFDGFLDLLRLNTLDVSEEHMGIAPGTWADEPSVEQNCEYCGIDDNHAPALSHARAIRMFVDNLHARADEIALVVHCSAGVSRSAAVAWWTSERFGIELHDRACKGLENANPRISRLLRSLS